MTSSEADALIRAAIPEAARLIRSIRSPSRFRESRLERAIVESLRRIGVPYERVFTTEHKIEHDWDPLPSVIDMTVSHEGHDDLAIAVELKVDDVDDMIWDAYKMIAARQLPGIVSTYLVAAATAKTFSKPRGCARLFAHDQVETDSLELFRDCASTWRRALTYRARPTRIPGTITTSLIAGADVAGYPGYELRAVSVAGGDSKSLGFDSDGWPLGYTAS
jgi:hypothetical protein